ncbi:MAG: hypothetical protein ACOCX4_10575, partial [Planctomycetota bacterium]
MLVASSLDALKADKGDLWDSRKVQSDQSAHVVYAGKPLESDMQCFWKVRVWDAADAVSPWSDPARWTMGVMK